MSDRKQQVIGLERDNLPELDVIERWARKLGADAFAAEVQRLAELYVIDPEGPIQAIRRQHHPSVIGVTDAPFQVLQRLCNQLIEREPQLLQRLSYRCRDEQHTALPWGLWLSLVRAAREAFDPAEHDAAFLIARQREGLSATEAFAALIAHKRRPELDTLVRHSFQLSPGRVADAGVWLLIEDPAVLSSLARQQALEQLWFGVLRNANGQILGMDVCLEQLQMRRSEFALYRLALDVWGPERLDGWLREHHHRHAELHGLALTRAWEDIDGGPLLDRLCQLIAGPVVLPAARTPGQTISFYRTHQRLVFVGLLQALPIERLDESLRELRLAVAVGL